MFQTFRIVDYRLVLDNETKTQAKFPSTETSDCCMTFASTTGNVEKQIITLVAASVLLLSRPVMALTSSVMSAPACATTNKMHNFLNASTSDLSSEVALKPEPLEDEDARLPYLDLTMDKWEDVHVLNPIQSLYCYKGERERKERKEKSKE